MTTPAARGIGVSTGRAIQLEYPQSIGVFDRYEDAQRAVDYLSDHEFPVQNVMIVGTDLRQIERVTGRLNRSKVIGAGAMSGAWLGLLIGTVLALIDQRGFALLNVAVTVVFGAVFGVVWAIVGYSLTRGHRDFTSVSQVVATKHEVLAEHKVAAQARELLAQMDPMRAAQEQVRLAQEQEQARAAHQQTPPASSASPTPIDPSRP